MASPHTLMPPGQMVDIAGMVLIDAAHEDEYAPFPDIDKMVRQMAVMVRLMKFAARLGLVNPLAKLSLGKNIQAFAQEELEMFLAIASQPKHHETMLAEFSQHRLFYGAQSVVPRSLGSIPLIVVTAENSVSGQAKIGGALTGDEMNALHQRLQKEMACLSTRGQQVIVPGATHFSIFARSEHADCVVDAIRRVVEAVRGSP